VNASARAAAPSTSETLYERCIILVTGRLDDGVAAGAAAGLVSLDATRDAPIEVHVDSPDDTLEAAFVLVDTLGMIRAPVRALCRGLVGTPAIDVVTAAGNRAASPHTRFGLAQPTVRLVGTPDEVESGRRCRRTPKSVEFWTGRVRNSGPELRSGP
jgi:ATP-dependent protease ClpP protease subunit